MIIFVESESIFGDTGVFGGVVPRRENIGFAVDGESLKTSRPDGSAFGVPATIWAVNVVMDAFHVIINYAANEGVATSAKARAVVIAVPDYGRESRRIANHKRIFGDFGSSSGGGTGF